MSSDTDEGSGPGSGRSLLGSQLQKFGVLALVIVLVAAGSGYFIFTATSEELNANTQAELERSSQVQAKQVGTWSSQVKQQVQLTTSTDAIQSGNETRIREFLETELEDGNRLPDATIAVHYVAPHHSWSEEDQGDIYEKQGDDGEPRILTSTEDAFVGANPRRAGAPFAQIPKGDDAAKVGQGLSQEDVDVYVSRPFSVRFTDDTAAAFITKVPNQDRLLIFMMSLDEASRQLTPSSGGEMAVVGSPTVGDGQYVYLHTDRDHINETIDESGILDAGNFDNAQSRTTYYRITDSGTDFVAAASPTDNGNWVTVSRVDAATAFALKDTVFKNLLLGGGALFAALLIVGTVVGNTARSISNLSDKATAVSRGEYDVTLASSRSDEVGTLYAAVGEMRDSLRDRIREAERQRKEAEAAREEIEQLNEELTAEVEDFCEAMGSAADGDLTVRVETDTDLGPVEALGEDFNGMMVEIEHTVLQLKNFAEEVAAASEEVTASSEEVRGASQQVTRSIQQISDGADRQNESLESVSREMNDLSTTVSQIAASSNEVADLAERTADAGRKGREAAQTAIAGMEDMESESEAAVDAIEQLESEVEQIDELIEFITDIAEQTNMLALNANIEAARAEHSSAGFAVVADEIKELARETKDAAGDIEERLERIQERTDSTAEQVQRTSDRVSENVASVEDVVGRLDDIAEYAEGTNEGVQEISAATQQQAASTEEAVAMVDEATSISEQTAAESQNVAAAAEQQTSALTEVSRSAGDLAEKASRLSAKLDDFDTDEERAPDVEFEGEVTEIDLEDVFAGGFGVGGGDGDDKAAEVVAGEPADEVPDDVDESGDAADGSADGEATDGAESDDAAEATEGDDDPDAETDAVPDPEAVDSPDPETLVEGGDDEQFSFVDSENEDD